MAYLCIYENIKENVKKVLHYYAKRANIRVGKKNSSLNSESLEDIAGLLTTKINRLNKMQYTNRYKYRQTKTSKIKHVKRVLTNWCKIILTGLAVYATLYIMLVAAGCPY